MAGLAA